MFTPFVASNLPTHYPYKLQKPSTASHDIRQRTETYILDSGIGDETTNAEVIELAHDLDADYVVPVDILHDQAQTTASIKEFVELYEVHDCAATVLYPLQPPHDEHYHNLTNDITKSVEHVAVGGIAVKDMCLSTKLGYIRGLRRVAPNIYAHGLGIGGGIEFVRAVAPTGLLNSIDTAAPEMSAVYGAVFDEQLRQQQIRVMTGDGVRQRNLPLAEFNAYQLYDVIRREAERDGLEQWQ